MIVTELYNGQGFGNQLWCYAVTKTIALDNNYNFGIMCKEKFKGRNFINLDFGNEVIGGNGPDGGPPITLSNDIKYYYKEKLLRNNNGNDISVLDSDLTKVQDHTKIDGGMQSEKYIEHRRLEICEWFKSKVNILEYSDDNICIIHFRGGDYKHAGQTLLPVNYYENAMNHMKSINPNIKFYVVTDDITLAGSYFYNKATIIGSSLSNIPDPNKANFHIGGDISIDYSIINNAKNLIISNSSFSWWATWTNQKVKNVIAPKYWAAYNFSNGFWSCGDSLTKNWLWLDRNNKIYNYDECLKELN